jgi:ATP-dependent helicase HrpA
VEKAAAAPPPAPAPAAPVAHTAWTFGALPELMEIHKAGQVLIGFPALIDKGAHVEIEVFDEPDVAALKHRAGLRRLVALAIKEPLKYLEKNIPDLVKMATLYMPLGTCRRAARPDHRGGAGPRLPGRPAAGRSRRSPGASPKAAAG